MKQDIKIQEFFKKWTETRPNLKVEFHEAGIEAMAFAEAYHKEKLRLHNVSNSLSDLDGKTVSENLKLQKINRR